LGGWYQPESGRRLEAVWRKTGDRWRDDLVAMGSVIVAEER
jgi:hypothetical protein